MEEKVYAPIYSGSFYSRSQLRSWIPVLDMGTSEYETNKRPCILGSEKRGYNQDLGGIMVASPMTIGKFKVGGDRKFY